MMARTIHGNLTGRAARGQISDELNAAYDDWVRCERQKLIDRENELYLCALDIEGFDAFWKSVPDFGKHRDRINMLSNFIQTNIFRDFLASHCQGAFQNNPP